MFAAAGRLSTGRQATGLLASGLLTTLLLGLLGLAVLAAPPAGAANRTVTLTGAGPTPSSIALSVGDAITFTNADQLGVSHLVSSTTSGWTYQMTIAGGASATTATFRQPGTYTYNDHRNTIGSDAAGSIVVTGQAAPSARPSSRPPTTQPASSPTASTAPTAAAPTPAAPTPAAPSPTGSALPVPSAATSPLAAPVVLASISPQPSASVQPDPIASTPVGALAIKGSVNNSNPQQAYGLPAALAAVAIGGVASLLVRLLLAHPAGRRRRAIPPA